MEQREIDGNQHCGDKKHRYGSKNEVGVVWRSKHLLVPTVSVLSHPRVKLNNDH